MVMSNMAEIVFAIDERLNQLDEQALRGVIGRPLDDLTLAERVNETVRVYEEFLAYKHGGKRIPANRTKAMIKRWGEKETVRHTVTNLTTLTGLELLSKYSRLDRAYEQIILDFADQFDAVLVPLHRGFDGLGWTTFILHHSPWTWRCRGKREPAWLGPFGW